MSYLFVFTDLEDCYHVTMEMTINCFQRSWAKFLFANIFIINQANVILFVFVGLQDCYYMANATMKTTINCFQRS